MQYTFHFFYVMLTICTRYQQKFSSKVLAGTVDLRTCCVYTHREACGIEFTTDRCVHTQQFEKQFLLKNTFLQQKCMID